MPVLSVIAGPNGSGKTTLIQALEEGGIRFGQYLNADDIARDLVGPPGAIAAEAQQIVRDRREAALCCLANLPAAIATSDKVDMFDNTSRNVALRHLAAIGASQNLVHIVFSPGNPIPLPVWWLELLQRIKPDGPLMDGPLSRDF